ncbi:amino acid racemase [Roseovarius spongiae]|uniref:Amino acid racemase n=1 Tax=Roseovarius spongiae TaxID=2320272 RepID=A0A3A8BB02_9RHOB|nr:amino acid racemase [Roseovarius spongiae]RKF16442.1 amino acid racemase [Roseovarius spongiae]
MRPVGILGGMGPEATILLMQKVLNAVDARDDADHAPLIVHQNPQVPSRIKALIEGTGADPAPALGQMARDLEAAGANALAMPCNTAHHYAETIRRATALPFLDMLALTAATLKRAGARRVGMLASPATRMVGVFDAPFAACGLEPVWARDEAMLLRLIRSIKAGEPTETLRPALTTCAGALRGDGADHLLVGCTELSLMADALDGPVTDTLDCLTAGIVDFATQRTPGAD